MFRVYRTHLLPPPQVLGNQGYMHFASSVVNVVSTEETPVGTEDAYPATNKNML